MKRQFAIGRRDASLDAIVAAYASERARQAVVMRDAQPAMVVDGATATLVVVPTPARFALHMLLVSQTRSVIQQTKGGKDLHQAALLLEALAADRPDDLEAAARSFADSGPAVTRKVVRGLRTAIARWPEAAAAAAILDPLLGDA